MKAFLRRKIKFDDFSLNKKKNQSLSTDKIKSHYSKRLITSIRDYENNLKKMKSIFDIKRNKKLGEEKKYIKFRTKKEVVKRKEKKTILKSNKKKIKVRKLLKMTEHIKTRELNDLKFSNLSKEISKNKKIDNEKKNRKKKIGLKNMNNILKLKNERRKKIPYKNMKKKIKENIKILKEKIKISKEKKLVKSSSKNTNLKYLKNQNKKFFKTTLVNKNEKLTLRNSNLEKEIFFEDEFEKFDENENVLERKNIVKLSLGILKLNEKNSKLNKRIQFLTEEIYDNEISNLKIEKSFFNFFDNFKKLLGFEITKKNNLINLIKEMDKELIKKFKVKNKKKYEINFFNILFIKKKPNQNNFIKKKAFDKIKYKIKEIENKLISYSEIFTDKFSEINSEFRNSFIPDLKKSNEKINNIKNCKELLSKRNSYKSSLKIYEENLPSNKKIRISDVNSKIFEEKDIIKKNNSITENFSLENSKFQKKLDLIKKNMSITENYSHNSIIKKSNSITENFSEENNIIKKDNNSITENFSLENSKFQKKLDLIKKNMTITENYSHRSINSLLSKKKSSSYEKNFEKDNLINNLKNLFKDDTSIKDKKTVTIVESLFFGEISDIKSSKKIFFPNFNSSKFLMGDLLNEIGFLKKNIIKIEKQILNRSEKNKGLRSCFSSRRYNDKNHISIE